MAGVIYLLILMRTKRFNAKTLSLTAGFCLAFAACLIPILT